MSGHHYFLFELWILLRAFTIGLTGIATSMLVQDKLCTETYHQSAAFCLNISQALDRIEAQKTRDAILADATEFTNYKNLIECVPMVLWSLFAGSFLDKFPGGTRIILFLGVSGDILAVFLSAANIYFFQWNYYLVLLPSLTYWLTGGMASFLTATYRYIIFTSTTQFRPMKLMIFAGALFVGMAFGSLAAGQILLPRVVTSAFPQLRTYHYNFGLNLLLDIICLGLVFTLESANDQKPDDDQETARGTAINCETDDEPSLNYSEVDAILDVNQNAVGYGSIGRTGSDARESSQSRGIGKVLVVLFDLGNVKETIGCYLRPRRGHIRLQLYLFSVILLAYMLLFFGSSAVMIQFTEKVYHWSPMLYSTKTFIAGLLQAGLLTLFTIFIVKRGKFRDESLIIIALLANFGQQLIMGTILSEAAYFVGQFVGAFGGFVPIGIRNTLSKAIPSEEVGKIFSLLSTIEATMPFFGSLLYSSLFAFTIATLPGFLFQFAALLSILMLGIMLFLDLYCRTDSATLNTDEEEASSLST